MFTAAFNPSISCHYQPSDSNTSSMIHPREESEQRKRKRVENGEAKPGKRRRKLWKVYHLLHM
jgi:hypothetical protein